MQLNKVFKGLLIALPILAVTACSSSDEAADAASQQTNNQEQTTTVATPVDQNAQLSEQEMKEQALREKQHSLFCV